MILDSLILMSMLAISYGGYKFIKHATSSILTKLEVLYYMICDLNKNRDDK